MHKIADVYPDLQNDLSEQLREQLHNFIRLYDSQMHIHSGQYWMDFMKRNYPDNTSSLIAELEHISTKLSTHYNAEMASEAIMRAVGFFLIIIDAKERNIAIVNYWGRIM